MGGCVSASNSGSIEEADGKSARRSRISNAGLKEPKIVGSAGQVEEDRARIAELDGRNIIDIMAGFEGQPRISMGSTPDLRTTSLGEKSVMRMGDEVDLAMNLGYACRKGLRPSPNQDSWFVLQVGGNFSIYAVFDGHGPAGHEVAHFVKENLPKLILDARFKTDAMAAVLSRAFVTAQELLFAAERTDTVSASESGTTATIIVHDHAKQKLYCANVANSAAVLGRQEGEQEGSLAALPLTQNHKPEFPEERERIEGSGGCVIYDGFMYHRVYRMNSKFPALNMSRCLGDLIAHDACGLSAEPAVSEVDIGPKDKVLILCSDGIWEFITHVEAVEMAFLYPPTTKARAMASAERLAREAWDRWVRVEGGSVVDDITVLLVYL